jgi:hypothetical protein
MQISFKQAPKETAESASFVVVNGAIVGRVERRQQAGLNRVKDYRYSGSASNGRTRRARLWEPSVDCVGLDTPERLAVKHHITKPKTDRLSAANHLIEAYGKAKVALPGNTGKQLAA